MLNSEKAFDMLPHVVDIYDKLDIDTYREKSKKKFIVSDKTSKKEVEKIKQNAGIDLVKYILKNSSKVKEEFFTVVAIFEGKTVEEVKAQPFTQTVKTFMDIFTDTELTDFFKSAMQ